jgi:hypothetical protein
VFRNNLCRRKKIEVVPFFGRVEVELHNVDFVGAKYVGACSIHEID